MPDSVGADHELVARTLFASALGSTPHTITLNCRESPIHRTVRNRMMHQLNMFVITHLNLSKTAMGAPGASALAKVLRVCASLEDLNLSGCRIKSEGVQIIAAVLPKCAVLTALNLHENAIGQDGARKIAAILPSCASLKNVHLSRNRIGDGGAMTLAPELPKCASLEHLNLAWNCIGHDGAFSLARILDECPPLRILDLNGNCLGDAGAFFLTFALKQPCTSLDRLDLSANNITTHRQKMLTQHVPCKYPNLPMHNLILRRPQADDCACSARDRACD